MSENKVLERAQIEEQYKWDLSSLFSDDNAWNEAFTAIDEQIDKLPAYAGKLSESPEMLREFLDAQETVSRKMSNIYCYASLRKSEDTRGQEAQVMISKAYSKMVKMSSLLSFVEPEILAMSDERLEEYLNAPALADYRFTLEKLIREKAHTLSEAEEKILAGMGEIASAPGDIAEMLQDADMVFDPIVKENGETIELTGSNFILLQNSTDREVREKAFKNYYKGFKQHINTFTATYSANVKADAFEASTRNYDSARAMSMAGENIPASVYDSLIETIHKYLPAMYRYVELRKKMLGVDELHMYDVYTPLMGDLSKKYTYDEAKEMVKKAVAPLGEDYVNVVQKGFDSRWIDVYPNVGKSGGAFSYGTHDSNPYIMTNFNGTIDCVSTLAHEMGHSMHSYYTRKSQPYTYGDHSIFTAEVASTVNESLLIQHLLKTEQDPEMRKYLINFYIEEFRTTLFRQTMFAEFELLAHEEIEKGGVLTPQWLNDTYEQLNSDYFGPAMGKDEYIKYEWSRIPHFYRGFYVYQYATGYSAATAISSKILNEGTEARDNYIEFLKSGSSNYPVELLKIAGVDMASPEPVKMAMETFKNLVDEFEKLM